MWDCEHCGCQAIAGTLTFCPQCFTPRDEDVAAESPAPDASASASATVEDREIPQPPEGPTEPTRSNESGDPNEGDWGPPDNGKDH
jgi:hypothetical protein